MENARFASERVALEVSILLMEQTMVSITVSLEAARKALALINGDVEKSAQQFDPILLCPIDNLELTTRSYNCLQNAGIFRIGHLVQRTEVEILEILRIGGLGRKTFNEIKEVLASRGLAFSMKFPNWPPSDLKR
ncbi:MAG: DNA-directed RNA polymerase subunit alpha C-terminal domain-containing protein [Minisyncoccia bacterium]